MAGDNPSMNLNAISSSSSVEAEIVIEAHSIRHEAQKRYAFKPNGAAVIAGMLKRRHAAKVAATCGESEEIRPHPRKSRHRAGTHQDCLRRHRSGNTQISGPGFMSWPCRPTLHSLAGQGRHQCARLPIEVDNIEGIKVCNIERPNAEAGKRQQMHAADAAHTGNRNRLPAARFARPQLPNQGFWKTLPDSRSRSAESDSFSFLDLPLS